MKKLAYILMLLLAVGITTAHAQRGLKRLSIKDADHQNVLLYNESHALVIGVSDYSGWPKLPGVLKDVKAVESVLEDQGFNVVTVVDPNREGLYSAFDEFINKYGQGAENRILIYFAGHGHTQQLKWGGDMGYIVPTDAPNPNRDNSGFLEKAMDMKQIEVYAQRIQSKHVLFLFDACFSGSIFALTRAVPQYISYKTAEPVRQFITSGSAAEEVPDESVFRSQFVEALTGEGDVDGDGYVTGAELGEFLQKSVVNYSNGCQHPQYGKIRNAQLDKGDFVFELASASAPPPPKAIPKPVGSDFSIADLNQAAARDEQVKSEWAEYLKKMINAYHEIVAYEKRAVVEPAQKVTAWERFRSSFSEDDPFTDEDATMRSHASARIKAWKAAAPSVSASAAKQPQPGTTHSGPLPGMTFVTIPAGEFMMGSPSNEKDRDSDESPQHRVTLSSFQMMTTEVTQGMWKAVMGNNPSNWKGDNLPVEQVSWNDCQEFLKKLNARDSGKNYRLPTEAEWEYACRAGTTTRFHSGNRGIDLNQVGWYDYNSGFLILPYTEKTHPVGQKEPNIFGLYDMHGNVWEWCEDVYHADYHGAPDNGDAWTVGGYQDRRVLRGGSYFHWARHCRSAMRAWSSLGDPDNSHIGFRVVCR